MHVIGMTFYKETLKHSHFQEHLQYGLEQLWDNA